jgi:RimJ/RimL family protein N-acetyltransferase
MVLHLDVPVLQGSLVRLEPLSMQHADQLARVVDEDRSSYSFTLVPSRSEVRDYIQVQHERAESGKLIPLAQIRLSDEQAVGCTAYWDPRCWPGTSDPCAVEIGWTWLIASAQNSGINREAKLLLLTHAFERWGVARVDLKTDARNEQCRRAIAGIGAQFEGVLRNWSPSWTPGEEGKLRDSAMFSLVAAEWPEKKVALTTQLRRN